jgi:hypothetical protein
LQRQQEKERYQKLRYEEERRRFEEEEHRK